MDKPIRRNNRITADAIQAIAAERRGICLNTEIYRNSDTHLRWKCELEHEWQATWDSIKYGGSWCPHCSRTIAGASTSKAERMCRRVIELMFKAPFPTSYPKWLARPGMGRPMELDGYNEELKIAFEYQGIQHYEAIGYFEKGKVERTQERDGRKARLCWDQGVNLIIIPPFDDLNDVEGILRQIETSVTRAGLKEARNWKARRPTHINQIWIPTDNSILTAIQKACDERGWKRLSTYVDCYTVLQWECSKGHAWQRRWNDVAKSTECPICRKETRAAQVCSIPECGHKVRSPRDGLCDGHRRRRERGQDLTTPLLVTRRNTTPTCTAPNCARPSHSHDLCTGHYKRWLKGKSLETPLNPTTRKTMPNCNPNTTAYTRNY